VLFIDWSSEDISSKLVETNSLLESLIVDASLDVELPSVEL